MRTIIVYSVLLIALIGSSVSAFDGKRKGFTAGIGFGYTPVMNSRLEYHNRRTELDDLGSALQVLIGYGFNERNVLVFQRLLAVEDSFSKDDCRWVQGQGTSLTYYRYFREVGKSAYVALGVGRHWQNVRNAEWGTGITLGIGHEITRR